MKTFFHKIRILKIHAVLLWMFFSLPFFIYGLTIFKYAVDIPIMDDFDAVLAFLSRFIHAQNLQEKLTLLFSQHNEHRIVLNRIISLGDYFLFHQVDFRFLIFFGNLGWILMILTLVRYFRKTFHLSLLQLLPIPYILLTFIHRETMLFATPAIQYYWFMFFAILFLICLSQNRILWVSLLFPLALYTFGGGIVLYPLGICYLVLQKRWKDLAAFFVPSTIFVALYFYHYVKPVDSPSIWAAITFPLQSIAYFFSFLGNVLPIKAAFLPIGIIIFVTAVILAIKKHGNSFLQLTMAFVGLTAVVASITRSGFGVAQAGSARYSLFSLLALVCLYAMLITSASWSVSARKIFLTCAILAAIVYWGTGVIYSGYTHYFQNVHDKRVASLVGFRNGDEKSLQLLYPHPQWAAQVLRLAEQDQIYDYHAQYP